MAHMTISHHATIVRSNSVQSTDMNQYSDSFDVVDQYIEKFGIDNARDLVNAAYSRPTEHKECLLIVRTNFITLEAQNALLKVLEEPPESTKFVFVLSPDFSLLSTLQSRFAVEEMCLSDETAVENEIFNTFFNAGYADRIAMIEKATKKKDLEWQQSIKQGLVSFIKSSKESKVSLAEFEYIARTLLTRGASNKMLCEHLALTLNSRS